MNTLTKAHLKGLVYFYAIMIVPFALAWGLYGAGIDLRPLLALLTGESPTGEMAGAYADCLVLILGALAGSFFLRKRMKANAAVINAVYDAPLSPASFQALALGVLLTGMLGFGLFLALAFGFLPYTFFDYSQGFPFYDAPHEVAGLAPRLAFLQSDAWIFLVAGAMFGAFMWGVGQRNKTIKYATLAAFVAAMYYNPISWFVEPLPISSPTLTESSADVDPASPSIEEEIRKLEVQDAPGAEAPAAP